MPRYIQWETSDIHVPWGLEADSKVFPVSVGDNEQLDARSATVHLSVFTNAIIDETRLVVGMARSEQVFACKRK